VNLPSWTHRDLSDDRSGGDPVEILKANGMCLHVNCDGGELLATLDQEKKKKKTGISALHIFGGFTSSSVKEVVRGSGGKQLAL